VKLWALRISSPPHALSRRRRFFRLRYRACRSERSAHASLRDIKARVGPSFCGRLKNRTKSIISDLPRRAELSEWVGLSSEQPASSTYAKRWDETLDAIARPPLARSMASARSCSRHSKPICNHPPWAQGKGASANGFQRPLGAHTCTRLKEIVDERDRGGDSGPAVHLRSP